jgi:hypothetical protein
LIQLVRVAVQEREDALQLGQRVLANLHNGRLVRLYHRHGARRAARVRALALLGRIGRDALAVKVIQRCGRLCERVRGRRRLRGRLGGRGRCWAGRGGGGRGRGGLVLVVGTTPL